MPEGYTFGELAWTEDRICGELIDPVNILLPSGWFETGYMSVPLSRPAELHPKRKAGLNPKGRHKLDSRSFSFTLKTEAGKNPDEHGL